MIGDDTEGIIETQPMGAPEPGMDVVPSTVPDDTPHIDEETALTTPPETELPDRPAP